MLCAVVAVHVMNVYPAFTEWNFSIKDTLQSS